MSKELVISSNRHETKLAILEDDQLVEVFFQRANEYSLAGSIHKGRVTRVLPGMQSAFVDLGLERDTFLYVSDFFEENEEFDRVAVSREEPRGDRAPRPAQSSREPAESPDGVEAGSEAPAATPEIAAAPAPPPERHGDSDGRDRHGRRSRRRRNRGRGFPDSKYASADTREPRYLPERSRLARAVEPVPAAEEAAASPVAESPRGDFSVLPGESLAKYSGAGVPPLDEAEEEEIRSLQESDAPAAEVASEAGMEAVEESGEPPELEAAPVVEAPETETPVEIPPATPAPSEPEVAEAVPEPERSGESDIETGEIEIEAAAEAEADADATTETPASSDPPAGAPAPQTAQVREQGGRYPHRVPRRMRRKMRGGGGPESRFDQQRRGDAAAPAPGETPIARPEPSRSVSRPEKTPLPSITELLKEGQEIIVQIAKEPLGQKGARITSHIALPGRYVVYMPTVEHTGVSRKIASDDERLRLKRILQTHHAGAPGGFIVRTAGEGKSEEDIAADMNFLYNLWLDIRQKAEKRPAPLLLHHDLDIVQRTLRDQFTEHFKAVWVDNEELYESILSFVQRFHPSLVTRVKLYTRPEPIFDAFNVSAELEKALRPKVWLKSGGYIVINQTEALVAIDVNTGKYVGRSNRLEDTIVKTNTEAVKEIVRQIRLRDLGGIIVVDFIDMDERKNRQKVMQVLEDAMRADRAPNKILQFNDFGLVAITRKRVKQSLERALCMPCPHCEGAGYVKSVQTIVGEILQEAHKIASAVEGKDVLLRVHPDVAKLLKSNHNKYLEELEDILRRPVLVRSDPTLHHEKFDLA
ncbi:MAG TPA: Rne/Rng family ribonuclease [Bryobacteraceae bacterium]|nr:Rne/Rng family ribonuclease [Bryobacteraceae bacterium]